MLERQGYLDASLLKVMDPMVYFTACNTVSADIEFEAPDLAEYKQHMNHAKCGVFFIAGDAISRGDANQAINSHWSGVWIRSTHSVARHMDSQGDVGHRAASTAAKFARAVMRGWNMVAADVEHTPGGRQRGGANCGFFVLCYAAAITECTRLDMHFPGNLAFIDMHTAAQLRKALSATSKNEAGAAAQFPDFRRM